MIKEKERDTEEFRIYFSTTLSLFIDDPRTLEQVIGVQFAFLLRGFGFSVPPKEREAPRMRESKLKP